MNCFQSTVILEQDLKSLGMLYNRTDTNRNDGIGYYFSTQNYLSNQMITNLINLSYLFVLQMKKHFDSRLAGTFYDRYSERVKWIQSIMMPKMHYLEVHVTAFVKKSILGKV